MYYTLYRTTNLINGKIYIGAHQTTNLKDSYTGSGRALIRAINKYKLSNFSKEILCIVDSKEDMYELEAFVVDEEFVNRKDTYNMKVGGFGGGVATFAMLGKHHSKKTKEKLRAAKLGTTHSEESKKKMGISRTGGNNHFFGKTHSEESKKKMSECKLGPKSNLYGIPFSQDHKNKISKALTGRKHTEEALENMRIAQGGVSHPWFGKKQSQEMIDKRVATRKKNSELKELIMFWCS